MKFFFFLFSDKNKLQRPPKHINEAQEFKESIIGSRKRKVRKDSIKRREVITELYHEQPQISPQQIHQQQQQHHSHQQHLQQQQHHNHHQNQQPEISIQKPEINDSSQSNSGNNGTSDLLILATLAEAALVNTSSGVGSNTITANLE